MPDAREALAASGNAALSLRLVEESDGNGYYGCVRGRRAQFIQGAPEEDLDAVFKQRPVLRGRFVMIGSYACGKGGCFGGSRAFPLDGRAPSFDAIDRPDERLVQIDGTVRGVVVELSSVAGFVLRSVDRRGRARALDTGAIEPGSLAIAGNRAYWIEDGLARSATL